VGTQSTFPPPFVVAGPLLRWTPHLEPFLRGGAEVVRRTTSTQDRVSRSSVVHAIDEQPFVDVDDDDLTEHQPRIHRFTVSALQAG